jgi:hypothetical protein
MATHRDQADCYKIKIVAFIRNMKHENGIKAFIKSIDKHPLSVIPNQTCGNHIIKYKLNQKLGVIQILISKYSLLIRVDIHADQNQNQNQNIYYIDYSTKPTSGHFFAACRRRRRLTHRPKLRKAGAYVRSELLKFVNEQLSKEMIES